MVKPWNPAKELFVGMILFGLFGLALAGCKKPLGLPTSNTVAVTGAVPVIDLPARPSLESLDPDELTEYNKLSLTARMKLQGNDKKLKTYAAELQVAIEDYNTYAAVRNEKSKMDVGVKGTK